MTDNLGDLSDILYAKIEEIARANAAVKELEVERHALEERLLQAMQVAGTDIVRGRTATVSISQNIRPQIIDFDEFGRFVLRKKALQLFHRQVAVKAYEEMKALIKKPIPGLGEYTNIRLNVRKV